MSIDVSPVSIVYCGPESSTWAGLLMKLCRQNPLFSLVRCASLPVAEINIAASSRAACMMLHGSFYNEAVQRGGEVLSARPTFFLAESGMETVGSDDEALWLKPCAPLEEIAAAVLKAILRFLEHHPSDPADSREVVGRAAHDLKSPLAAILAYCHIALSSNKTGERSRKFFTRIEANAKQADDLIVRHMTGFMAAQGRLKVVAVPTCVSDWMRDELSYEIEIISKKGLRFEVSVDKKVPKQIMFDRLLLSQIMKNLLENASKHTESGFITVSATYLSSAGRLRIDVADSGKGISLDSGHSVFQMFAEGQGTDQWQRKFRSIGIGLNNARRLARLMGGDVTLVESCPGRGTTFRVELDCRTAGRGMELAERPSEAARD